MIQIQLSEDNFQYDVYTLVKAFFPEEDVKVMVGLSDCLPEEGKTLQVCYQQEKVTVTIKEKGIVISEESVTFESAERKQKKNRLKKLLYGQLSKVAGRQLPWGNLTGIRPIKIVMSMLEQGKSSEEVEKSVRETYCISEEKAKLSLEIAERELEVLNTFPYKEGYSLYVGIPFCPTTCLYCSFTSYPIGIWRGRTGEYLAALYKELEYIAGRMKHKRLDSVYIGGGTPTTLSAGELNSLLSFIREKFDCSNVKEFCVEAGRPDSITIEKLSVLKESGVKRISINPQTMNDKTLQVIGRQHSVEDIRCAYDMAASVGFPTINMDIILGLPGENLQDLEHTLKEIEKLAPQNLTVHSLALKRAARLNIQKQSYVQEINAAPAKMMKMAAEYAETMGMVPYYLYRQKNMGGNLENVGYAARGHIGLYNILIMEEKQTIMAAGAGAMTKNVLSSGDIVRVENVKDVANYIERVDEMIARKEEVFKSHERKM